MKPGPEFWCNINYDKIKSEGLEAEVKYDFGKGSYLRMNYTYLIYKKRRFWMIPRHVGNIMLNIRFSRFLNFYSDCHFECGWKRSKGDSRDDMSGYGIVNTSIILKKFLKGFEGFEIRGSIYNLFDKDYTSPTDKNELPGDLPMPGRNFMIELKYRF